MRLFNLITFLLSLLIFAVFVFLAVDTVRAQPIGEWDLWSIHLNGDNDSSISAQIEFPLGVLVPKENSATLRRLDFGSSDGHVRMWLDDDIFGSGYRTFAWRGQAATTLGGTALSFWAGPGSPGEAGGFLDFQGGAAGTGAGGNGGGITFIGGAGRGAGNSGGNNQFVGGGVASGANYGYSTFSVGGTPGHFTLTNSLTQSSVYVQGNLEVDGTTWLDGNALVGGTLNVTGATTLASSLTGILKGTSGLIATASSSDLLTAIGTIDISSNTNLAVSSPITLTGDTVGFDQTANFTWTGTHSFNNTTGITLNSTSPIITFTDSTASEDDFSLATLTGVFTLTNTTDSRVAFSVSGAGTNTFGAATSGSTNIFNVATSATHIFQVNSAQEVQIAANRMTFEAGGSDPYLDWTTSGRLDVGGGIFRATGTAIIQASSFTPYVSGYELSIQSNGGYTYLEILNAYGAGGGAFFGMEGTGVAGDAFALYNYQGGPIIFYTDPSAVAGTVTFKIEDDGNVGLQTGKKFYFEMGSTGTFGDTYVYYDSGSSSLKFYVNGVLSMELK